MPGYTDFFEAMPTGNEKELSIKLKAWEELASTHAHPELREWIAESLSDEQTRAVIEIIFSYSPYLSRLLLANPDILRQAMQKNPDSFTHLIIEQMRRESMQSADMKALMRILRIAKGRMALVTAIADIAGMWPLDKVTYQLSAFADECVMLVLNFLLNHAHKRADIQLSNTDDPCENSGVIILGMGKLGAYELNYSSDIDLIIFYEKDRLGYKGKQTEQQFYNRLSQDLVTILHERTNDGYVFRTDLRLRPDPASTPPAISVNAALFYYESVGQNWERAAMIKARPIAGDKAAGNNFLRQLIPFLWRKHLDFAAINDIHSIKRQMDHRTGTTIMVAGHNIKLGLGGIREIEFYVQVHQLIWGGRELALRLHGTCETIDQLAGLNLISEETQQTLCEAYVFLRNLEHRLQMVEDQQTHSLPTNEEELHKIARFMGFADSAAFSDVLTSHLHAVHEIFTSSFHSAVTLADEGNLVFTGTIHDPATIATLKALGYKNPEVVSDVVMGWHHGSRRCTRSKRTRELLTELMPALLKRLSETASPDAAFLKFDEFSQRLPSGIQLFSLFTANPVLLKLVADIMGSAPMLAETLSKHPDLIEVVLYGGFYDPLPAADILKLQLQDMLAVAEHTEEKLNMLRSFKNEKQFQAGVQLLRGMIGAEQSGAFLSHLADVILQQAYHIIVEEFIKSYGRIEGAQFCIIALGKLGSCELTFGSDLDLVFIYDVPDFEALSDGQKSYSASVYFNRFAQRLFSAITTLSKEGSLYEVDTRLRPSGKQGLLAVSLKAMRHYFDELAWTFERMAFTKARVAAGDKNLSAEITQLVEHILIQKREAGQLASDVLEMRTRIAKEFPATNEWDIKYARGGLLDADFIAQFLVLKYAPSHPQLLLRSASEIFAQCQSLGLLDAYASLPQDNGFLVQLFNMLRLTAPGNFESSQALPGLKMLLTSTLQKDSFDELHEALVAVEKRVMDAYMGLIAT